MAWLIDTCILSELRKSRPHDGVVAWMEGVQPDEAWLSALSLGEIRRGIELRRSRDAAAARSLERWLHDLETHYADRVLPVIPPIADRWGRLSLNQPLPVTDGLSRHGLGTQADCSHAQHRGFQTLGGRGV